MLPIRGVYEIAVRVRDLPKAEAFYCGILGLRVGLRNEPRRRVFLYAGDRAGMVVLIEDKGEWPTLHFAFTVNDSDIEPAAEALRARGVAVEGPQTHDWMPSRSIYFKDPDGHSLELIALPEESQAARQTKALC